MYLWTLSNPDLTKQLLAGQNARAEAMSRAGYLTIRAVEQTLAGLGRAVGRTTRAGARAVSRYRRRRQAIAALRALDNRMLADIGISRGDIVELVDGVLDQGPGSVAELRGLPRRRTRPVPQGDNLLVLPKAA